MNYWYYSVLNLIQLIASLSLLYVMNNAIFSIENLVSLRRWLLSSIIIHSLLYVVQRREKGMRTLVPVPDLQRKVSMLGQYNDDKRFDYNSEYY